ncbi:MAG: T9SS type A sorting domain-containing protein [Bacteroidetes bacterium]|nr:T9SS type A sorting domain-containing protein [Bacteroidota bacterium]
MKLTKLFILAAFFIVSLSLNAQIPNQGFETWVTDVDGNVNPAGWETTNSFPDISVSQYTPAYAGSFSMLIKTFDPGFMTLPGFASFGFPYNLKPTKINACIKTNIMPGDNVSILVSLWNGDSLVASPTNCTFVIDSTINQFTCLSFPITYQSALIPDSAYIMITAGKFGSVQLGTQIIVDELTFGFGTGINEIHDSFSASLEQNIPNPAVNSTVFPLMLNKSSNVNLIIYDVLGKEVKHISFGKLNSGNHDLELSLEGFSNGVYYCSFQGDDFLISKKIIVSK